MASASRRIVQDVGHAANAHCLTCWVPILIGSFAGHTCFRERRKGERKRKAVRGCIVDGFLSVIHLVIIKKGEGEIPGLTGKPSQHPLLLVRSRVQICVNLCHWRVNCLSRYPPRTTHDCECRRCQSRYTQLQVGNCINACMRGMSSHRLPSCMRTGLMYTLQKSHAKMLLWHRRVTLLALGKCYGVAGDDETCSWHGHVVNRTSV